MRVNFPKPPLQPLLAMVAGLIVLVAVAACERKSGEAVVIEKEHIAVKDAGPATNENPATAPSASAADDKPIVREMAGDEISPDGFVMKRNVRGTGKDPRATHREQWVVRVRLTNNGREIKVQTDQPKWEKLKIGDEVQITYRQGKYTRTIWGSEIK